MPRFLFNPFTNNFDQVDNPYFRGVLASAPSSPIEGWTYINSTDNGYYIYYAGTWQLLHTLTAPSSSDFFLLEDGFELLLEDGFELVLEGSSSSSSLVLLEDGFVLLFENDDRALIEDSVAASYGLLEDNFKILMENSDNLTLE